MAEVWDRSKQSGTNLLMLLAIADFADDDGRAYPSVASLARKCRMKPRNAQTILANLRESGELTIRVGSGPKGTNLYRIPPLQGIAPLQDSAPMQRIAPEGAKDCAYPLQGIAPKPSVNHQEPSDSRAKGSDKSFDTFWERYPRKLAKQSAEKAWRKLKPSGDLLIDLMSALEKQKASPGWLKDSGQFIPYPATWLNDRRWEDEPTLITEAGNQSDLMRGAI